MTCDVQGLIDDARCFLAVSPQVVRAIQVKLWCEISQNISGGGGGNIVDGRLVLFNEADGQWYASGQTDGVFDLPVLTVPPVGANPTVFIESIDDATVHEVGVMTDDLGDVVLYVEQDPSGNPPEVLTMGGYTVIVQLNPSFVYEVTLQ